MEKNSSVAARVFIALCLISLVWLIAFPTPYAFDDHDSYPSDYETAPISDQEEDIYDGVEIPDDWSHQDPTDSLCGCPYQLGYQYPAKDGVVSTCQPADTFEITRCVSDGAPTMTHDNKTIIITQRCKLKTETVESTDGCSSEEVKQICGWPVYPDSSDCENKKYSYSLYASEGNCQDTVVTAELPVDDGTYTRIWRTTWSGCRSQNVTLVEGELPCKVVEEEVDVPEDSDEIGIDEIFVQYCTDTGLPVPDGIPPGDELQCTNASCGAWAMCSNGDVVPITPGGMGGVSCKWNKPVSMSSDDMLNSFRAPLF